MITPSRLGIYLARARPWFEARRDPAEFMHRINQVDRIVDSEFLFNRNEAKWVREALNLAAYSQFISPSSVWLNGETWPDAFVREDGKDIPLEITMILDKGREIGREYRMDRPFEVNCKVDDWVAVTDAISRLLAARIQSKLQKRYSISSRLLIYLNANEWGIRQKQFESAVTDTLRREVGSFSSVDVLWKDKLLRSSGEVRWLPNLFH